MPLQYTSGGTPVEVRAGRISYGMSPIALQRAYVANGVPFLLDESDTVLAYENRGRLERGACDPLLTALNALNHVQQLEVIYGEAGGPRSCSGSSAPAMREASLTRSYPSAPQNSMT